MAVHNNPFVHCITSNSVRIQIQIMGGRMGESCEIMTSLHFVGFVRWLVDF